MFGNTKPTFGANTTNFVGFGNTSTTPFGQSTFGKTPAPAFGAPPAFGTTQATPSLFNQNPAQTQQTSLFGASTSGGFGGTTTTPSTFGGFGQPQQNTSIFAPAQTAANTSLFGQAGQSTFGSAVKPGFGQAQPASVSTSLFGQQTASTSASAFGGFGQPASTATNMFGSGAASAFGQPQNVTSATGANTGTSIIKYQPTVGTDTLMKNGTANNINTKQHCITSMKEYEQKSLEELRMEDYLSGRKGPQAGPSSGGFFGTNPAGTQPTATGTGLFGTQPSQGLFGQVQTAGTENKGLFGQSAFGQPTATSAFGGATQTNNFLAKPFGAPNTTSFGTTTNDASNLFGQKSGFGQTTSLFGQQAVPSTAPGFGQTNTSSFGGFGTTTANQQPSLFGTANTADANKPTFGIGTSTSLPNTNFGGFGSTATNNAGGGLFGTKPATSFGTASSFGQTSQPNTGFSNFSINNTATGSGGLFNNTLNKPAASGFGGFGTQTSAPLNFNAGNTGGSLFGNTVAKPGGLFGGTGTLGAAPNNVGTSGFFSSGAGTFASSNSLGGGFGTLGGNTTMSGALGGVQHQITVPIHQQILAKVTSPYGDTPIFKDLKRNDEADATRATNPAAQQAVLDLNNGNLKIESKSNPSVLKVKPVNISLNRKSLFDGLEQFDASVENFTLKPNAKRLLIKSKNNSNPNSASNSPSVSTDKGVLTNGNSNGNSEYVGAIQNGALHTESTTEAQTLKKSPQIQSNDNSRRESWLHPNNLEKVRQHNLQADSDSPTPLNSTLNELVPRKPIETYRHSTSGGRLSTSSTLENLFEDQSNSIAQRDTIILSTEQPNDSIISNRSYGTPAEPLVIDDTETEPHPTGIILKRVGYYTIPNLDELKSYLAEDGSCIVPNFTIGREGYGNVYFGKEMDVSGLNLDEIVHFRNKEIIVYPDDESKPPIGQGLNREAQVTLDKVWPLDKTKHEPIKDPERLNEMDWEGKLRRVCGKNDTRFIEYRSETGSWVFRVKHFSKYGLNDSDEEEVLPTDPKKAKVDQVQQQQIKTAAGDQMTLSLLKNAQKLSEEAARELDPRTLAGFASMDESNEFMLMDKTQYFQTNGNDFSLLEQPRPMMSPTSTFAKEVAGNDSHKLQLMKSSLFFDVDNDKPAEPTQNGRHDYLTQLPNLWKDVGASSETSSQFDFGQTSPPMPASSSASVMSIAQEMQSETSSSSRPGSPEPESEIIVTAKQSDIVKAVSDFVFKPEVASVKKLIFVAPLVKSIAQPNYQMCLADLGLYKSHGFKTSFGLQNTLIVPTTQTTVSHVKNFNNLYDAVSCIFKTRNENDYSAIILQQVKITATKDYRDFKERIVPHLEIQLRTAITNEIDGSECPWFQSDNGNELIVKHLEQAIKLVGEEIEEEYTVSVWSLLLALWGKHELLQDQEENSHFSVMYRRNLLSEWLENTLVGKDLLTKQVSKHSYLEHILDLLMCHRVTEACELAFSYNDANLALILAQLSGGPVVRHLVSEQLSSWNMTKADKYISVERLKMYMMVAGVPLMSSSHGPINVLEDINWLKVLALQLWYFTSPTSSITDALLAYDKSFKSTECYCLPPTPKYVDEPHYNGDRVIYDLHYHLLHLYSMRNHSLDALLNPITHTTDPMDYRLSWLLLQTLEALGYHHCSKLGECQLHVDFATQLENNGLWEWAIFVLLHIKERNQREIAVQNLLYRYVKVSEDVELTEQEVFVIDRLGVPEKWIDYAKAVKAGASRQYHLQAKYLLKAKQWVLAHEVIYHHIAPDAIINNNFSYLYELLTQFESTEQRTQIRVPNWANQGQIFLDFIDISEKFKQIKSVTSTEDIEARWENLKPQLSELCSRINLLPCPTAKHRLCQSEIAQNLACFMRGMLIACPNPCMVIKIALERLPLPQEFVKKELHILLNVLVDDITKMNLTNNSRTMMAAMGT